MICLWHANMRSIERAHGCFNAVRAGALGLLPCFFLDEYARRGFLMFYRQVCGHFFGRHCLIVLALLWDLEGYHSACAVQCSFLPKDLCKIHF
jgi:hypothetical protein